VCLALVALDAHSRYPLLIAANRDEFHARAAEPAKWWPEEILAGRDSVGGGTWFGVTRRGRWALITNYREGVPRDPAAPSRGELVRVALRDATPPVACAARLAVDGTRYHGYNLLIGDALGAGAAYTSNRASGGVSLDRGISGLSNHLLETPWPKLLRAKARLATAMSSRVDPIEAAFELLADRERAPAASLPSTGVSPEWERLLSSAFIVHRDYGTRCSTVLAIDSNGHARFIERSFDATGQSHGEAVFDFEIEPRA
jgi:uncharacterized protein with NRDE domain